jgi:hypothetical protein
MRLLHPKLQGDFPITVLSCSNTRDRRRAPELSPEAQDWGVDFAARAAGPRSFRRELWLWLSLLSELVYTPTGYFGYTHRDILMAEVYHCKSKNADSVTPLTGGNAVRAGT